MAGVAHPRTHSSSHDSDKLSSPVHSSVLGPRVATALQAVPDMNGRIRWQLLVPGLVAVAAKQRLGYCRNAPRG